ncbi:MAG TPA: transcription termination/antitermination protein NusG [Mollicutes bacterium]|nr:transcription termination/antitermination protein NusG [Mollicutes bacterium]
MEEKRWYVVNTYSGHEKKVKEKLEMRIETMDMQENIFRVVVPEHTEIEVKDGVKKEKSKKLFPGYVLVEMIMSDEAWYVVRNTPGVTGFIGSSGKGAKPIPLLPSEIDRILGQMGMSRLELGSEIKENDKVKIIAGPFTSMIGRIESIDLEHQKLKVMIDLFGQETSVEVELSQVEKA